MAPLVSTTEQKHARKERMIEKTRELFSTHSNYMIVNIFKVRSTQFKDITSELPSNMKLLFAKKKIIKKVLKELNEKKYKEIIEKIRGNVIVVFFDGVDPRILLEVSSKNMRRAHAAPGDFTEKPIIIPAGPTGLPPEKINIFQAARIQTKINKGKIDLASDHVLVKPGTQVSISDASLLHMLGIMPFEYGTDIIRVYEGEESYGKEVLSITNADIESSIKEAVSSIAAVSLGSNFPTVASVPYIVANAYADIKKVMLGLDMKN